MALDNKEECYRFFEDLVTVKELQAMSNSISTVVESSGKSKKAFDSVDDMFADMGIDIDNV
mgnify:CR=1 FL=1